MFVAFFVCTQLIADLHAGIHGHGSFVWQVHKIIPPPKKTGVHRGGSLYPGVRYNEVRYSEGQL